MTDISTATATIVHALAGAPVGGAENFYTRLVCRLADDGSMAHHAFTRPNAARESQLRQSRVPIQTFRFGSALRLDDRLRYRRALTRLAPDLVLTYMNRASGLTPVGDYTLVCRLGHYYDLKYYRHADYWIGISKGICKHMIDGGFPTDRVFHIPNFADETPVEPVPRNSFETDPGRPLLLAAGRLHVNKAYDTLLDAFVQVPDATLWIAGEGPEQDRLQDQARRLGIADRIRWLGWRTDVVALMKTADAFVCPSRHEGLGSIVMESWFAGCPIVATDSQGPGEAIDHDRTGIITPVDEPAPLTDALSAVLGDPQLRKRLAKAGAQEYAANYSAAVITSSYLTLFRDLLSRR
ncbi:MAG: glycosyltransferase [Pseudomonadota bacterium]